MDQLAFLGKFPSPLPACEAAGAPFFSISLPPSPSGEAPLLSKLQANHFILGQMILPG